MRLNKVKTYDKNFTRTFNEVLQDSELSWKARGIFGYLWSLPDTREHPWNYLERNIVRQAPDGKDSLVSGVKELRHCHYLSISRDHKGHTTWTLSDHKMRPHSENPHEENPDEGKPHSENPNDLQTTHYYKQLTNTNKQATRDVSQMLLAYFPSYYQGGIKITRLKRDVRAWSKHYSNKQINGAINRANNYQMRGNSVYCPPKLVNKILEQSFKKNHLKDSGFINMDHVNPYKQAKKNNRYVLEVMKKRGIK